MARQAKKRSPGVRDAGKKATRAARPSARSERQDLESRHSSDGNGEPTSNLTAEPGQDHPDAGVRAEKLKQVTHLLEQSQDRFDFAPMPYATLDRWGVVESINLTGATFLETDRSRIVGLPLRAFIAPHDRQKFLDHMWLCRQEEGYATTELSVQTAKKKELSAVVVSRRSVDITGAGPQYSTAILDMSERTQHEAGRNRLLQQILEAQEQERHRLSRELHDQMGQYITALIFGLKVLQDRVEPDQKMLSEVRRLLGIADDLGRETHRLALNLRPTALDDLGLRAALGNYLDDWATRTGVRVRFECNPAVAKRVPPHIETTVYRIVQEATTNIAKHAKARHVGVVIHWDSNQLQAIIEDDGQGFNLDVVKGAAAGRLGLAGMRERVALVNGTFDVESGTAGTTLFIRIPLPKHY